MRNIFGAAGNGDTLTKALDPFTPAARIFNDTKPAGAPGALFEIRNEAKPDEPLEVLIYEAIGKSDWTGEGMDAKAFLAKLDGVPKERALNLRINSRGGDVFDGLAIYNRIKAWAGRKIATVDGVAASIASVIAMAADEIHMPKASQMLIHDAWGIGMGNAEDMRGLADRLDQTSDQIAGIYADRTGNKKAKVREWMRDTKIMTGEEAKALNFADTLTDGDPIYNFSPEDVSAIAAMCRAGSQPGGTPPQPKEPQMDRTKLIALLKQYGAAVDEKATDDQLLTQLNALLAAKPTTTNNDATIAALQNRIAAAEERERKDRVERAIDKCIAEDRIPLADRADWVARAMKDETILALAAKLPAAPSVKPLPVLEVNASGADLARHFGELRGPARGTFYSANRDRIFAAAGDNTVPAGLQQQVIIQDSLRAFASAILPLKAFSTVFANVPLKGTAVVDVPYYDLQTASSTDWNAANGYVAGETVTAVKAVTVNKRKYQAMSATSSELARQPFLRVAELMKMNAEKLGVDVFADVLSAVTLANFGAASVTKAAALFSMDDVADIRTACNTASWPTVGRSLILSPDYDGALAKDAGVVNASAFGAAVAQTGTIPKVMGFDYYWTNNIPANAQNLVGFAVFPSALLVVTSPIAPAPMTRQSTTYEVYTDPTTGVSFEHRAFGDPQMDKDYDVIECNYGYVLGNAAALKRIVSA